jgi:hypothetical protein
MKNLSALALLFAASTAGAIPAPMSEEEMTKRADAVIEAEVKNVTCGERADKGDFVSTEYKSELAVTRTISGKAPPTITLSGYRIEWKDDDEAPVGGMPPTAPLPVGWRGKLYLDELPGGGYSPVWYNAIEPDPPSEGLPKCGGGGCGSCAAPVGSAPGWGALALLALIGARRFTRS